MATILHSPDPGTLTETTVVLRSKRRERAQLFNHAGPGLVLLLSGVTSLLDPGTGPMWLAALSLVAGGALVVAILRQFKSLAVHDGIAWVDIFAGAVLFIEALQKYHDGKQFLPYAYALIALATLLLGIFHDSISRGRFVRLTRQGITARPSRRRSVNFKWEELRSIAIGGTEIRFDDLREQHSLLDLRGADNRDEAFGAIREFAAAMNVRVQEITP